MKNLKRILLLVLVVILVGGAAVTYKLYKMNAFIWLGDYVWNSPSRQDTDQLTDIIVVPIDHWEPGGDMDIVNKWMTGYRELADKHVDADGVKLQHTWFYPIDQFRGYEVDSIVELSREGYGDVEVHLHHRGDNSASLTKKFVDGLDSLQAHGALISPDGKDHWAFVHGNWALDNSRVYQGRDMCGVDNEITILQQLGCYCDMTFPAMGQTAQPSLVNKIYYCIDDPNKPKSYDTGVVDSVGFHPAPNQFMLIEGPYVIDWSDWRFKTHPTLEDGDLYWEIPTTFHRFQQWLKADVHVKGRPNWVFVRPFTHGAHLVKDGYDNILGKNIDKMLTEVEKRYNDGKKYRLHYMTAREAYNVVKAAEDGKTGNPNNYRDYVIKKYDYRDMGTR